MAEQVHVLVTVTEETRQPSEETLLWLMLPGGLKVYNTGDSITAGG